MNRARMTAIGPRLVLALGLGAAAVLCGAAFLDFGDPGAVVLNRLSREAESEGRLVLVRWEAALASSDSLAAPAGSTCVEEPAEWPRAESLGPAASGEGALQRLAARAAAARGDHATADRLWRDVIAGGKAASGSALLDLVVTEGTRAAAIEDLVALMAQVPWTATVEGTSGKLLAVLSAGPELDHDEKDLLREELESALLRGDVALPVPADTALLGEPGFAANGDGWSFDFDPWWEALTAASARQLGGSLDGWQRAFHRDGRGASALARAAAARLGEPVSTLEKRRWHLRALPGTAHWLAVRVEGGEVRLELQAGSALADALRGLGSDGSDLVPTAFEANSAGSAMAELGLLTGTDEVLDVRHPNPRGLVEREERRITYLRGGLWVLAALVLLTTAASSRQMARARELHRLRTTFVASVSHDLRTPLASIRLMAENLSSGYAKGREERYVGSIQREVGRLSRLVDDLLDFGRIERGLLPNLQRRPMVIAEWLDGFAARERARCAAASCAFSWELEGDAGSAWLDSDALERAVGNLVDNALRHGGAEAIRLRVRRDQDALLTLEVLDSGTGLQHGAVHEHLFRPFERGHGGEGTGLGLSIVRAIAEAHGGRAELATGEGGRGVCARILVPTAMPEDRPTGEVA